MSVLMPAPFLPFLESSLCTVYKGPVINGVVNDVCTLHNFPGAGLRRALETEVKALKILLSSCVSCVKPDSYYALYPWCDYRHHYFPPFALLSILSLSVSLRTLSLPLFSLSPLFLLIVGIIY